MYIIPYKRHIQSLLHALLGEFRIVYLTGPRQSGKTTLAPHRGGEPVPALCFPG